ncbi:protein translocase subunit SecD [Gilliamella sp. B14448G11]|uniref:protein translocase subunit SecD n=1 Tax=unclassified Gilliamella TaxID=2685620 RepID=UPI0018DB4CDF|nr:protein translocase subunit SecD [Gilliamella sp. B14448G11]MBI0029235.1 protein translocase subunit SecD [Gilliamella sp. B14448G7]MBI0029932.1 protein translocase subunit SecD [Gilliamella sp. B14384G15]MBI0043429.1 protein translocase subunit SecD [Gilliamella sp. B14448G12]MBI0057711.1 protein translocase subunit SecD [Gilliamella sp. B14384G12]MBI0036236.1 protein translocase subunit SecD [Gilliamella sp. B14448G11]
MLNRYPLWKYIMLVVVICVGLLYALPNIYGEDPAIQISGSNTSDIDITTQDKIRKILADNHIETKSFVFENKSILIRVGDNDTQLKAKELISKELGDAYIVALNLAPATPKWLTVLGAEPMKLGLDLRGGVHFLMEVDMTTALSKLTEQSIENLRFEFNNSKLKYKALNKDGNQQIVMQFDNTEDRNKAITKINGIPDFKLISQTENSITLSVSEQRLQQAKNDAVQQNTTILRNRVNQLGVAEPIVQRQGADRIVVELPGIQDTALAKSILGATATLEFRQVNEENTANLPAMLAGEMRVPYGSEIKYMENGRPVLLYKRIVLTGDHITDSSFRVNEYGQPEVSITLDSSGGKAMLNFTQKNIHKAMATLFVEYKDTGKRDENDKPILEKQERVINVATIQGIFSERFQVTGISSVDQARNLSLLLRAGALIAPIQIIEERTVGPSMGQENITQGLESCVWGLLVSVIFMLIMYRLFGVFASLALIANLILIVGIMSLLPGATLSMPGIAGIVLTVGMAVDANVLINERIKEELSNGRGVQHAINEGYAGAWSSIFDANLTTLITAVILYAVGTGSIKGFAITLGIGIITSMFTSIVGTRALANLIYGGRRVNKLSI